MLATSFGVLVETAGGSRGKTRRAVFTAPAEGGWVDVAPALPGDVHTLQLDGMVGWCVARGSWLAATASVRAEAQWAGFRGLFGTDAGFLEHVAGDGALVLTCCGALDVVSLDARELVTVDPSYLLAYTDMTQVRLRAVNPQLPQSVRTGEGLLLDFAGPGQLLVQTRSARAVAAALTGGGGR
jgi:uncharacterized protein (AIM24 family)